jgi:hypothetical protein
MYKESTAGIAIYFYSNVLSQLCPLKDSIKSDGEAAALVAMWFVSKRGC